MNAAARYFKWLTFKMFQYFPIVILEIHEIVRLQFVTAYTIWKWERSKRQVFRYQMKN